MWSAVWPACCCACCCACAPWVPSTPYLGLPMSFFAPPPGVALERADPLVQARHARTGERPLHNSQPRSQRKLVACCVVLLASKQPRDRSPPLHACRPHRWTACGVPLSTTPLPGATTPHQTTAPTGGTKRATAQASGGERAQQWQRCRGRSTAAAMHGVDAPSPVPTSHLACSRGCSSCVARSPCYVRYAVWTLPGLEPALDPSHSTLLMPLLTPADDSCQLLLLC